MSTLFSQVQANQDMGFVFPILLILILSLLIRYSKTRSDYSELPIFQAREMLRKAATYAFQAEQDHNPIIAMKHANYASAYLEVFKDLSSDRGDKTKIDVPMLLSGIARLEKNCIAVLGGQCSNWNERM